MSTKAAFYDLFPQTYFLDPSDLHGLGTYLAVNGRLDFGETLQAAEKAGEGNMNCTVRVGTSARTFILKQSRPWLEKYPQIAGPFDRTLIEGRFYRLITPNEAVASRMPRLLWTDDGARMLALEDLGRASDFFPLYAGGMAMGDDVLAELLAYLSALHRVASPPTERAGFVNREMRTLNHEHIFALPLRERNGLDLDAYTRTPGLAAASVPLKNDSAYRRIVAELGERYLHGEGDALLHGDFFPGSFLQTGHGVRVIDPEFCFYGEAEFDLGVLAAHLLLAGEPASRAEAMFALYELRPGEPFARELARQYAGVEIMRRLIGVAQIPTLNADLNRKTALLALSQKLVKEPEKGF